MSDSTIPSSHSWTDTRGAAWRAFIETDRIVLRDDRVVMTIERDRWPTDLYITTFQGAFLLRVETFERSLQFILSTEQIAPLLELLGPPVEAVAEGSRADSDESAKRIAPVHPPRAETDADGQPRRLIWPKVSSLAVWALILSSLAFIPLFGLVPGIGAVMLLVLHRKMVRRTEAMRHSRTMCLIAFLFLSLGAVVNTLAIREGARRQGSPPTAVVSAPPAAPGERNWGMIACAIVVVILSLSVHEAGHAITAWWLGDGLAKSLGRVTLNPLSHIDPVGTVLLPIILALAGAPVFGYARPVPVQVGALPRHRRAHILISIAGPGSNLLLACASLMLLLGGACVLQMIVPEATVQRLSSLNPTVPVSAGGFVGASSFASICTFLKLSVLINVALALFNMFPIPPLDGSWVLEHLFPRTLGPIYAMVRPYGFLIFILAIYGDVFDYLFVPLILIFGTGLGLVSAATGW